MHVCRSEAPSSSLQSSAEPARVRRVRRSVAGLVVLMGMAFGSPAMAGSVGLPLVQQVNLDSIDAGAQVSYSFNQGPGPLATDFDDTNGSQLTTARYIFNGTAISNLNPSVSVPVFTQWSPAVNATGGFVPFLGNDRNGHQIDTKINPTRVANITDAFGNVYGYILADHAVSATDNTTFTVVNTTNHGHNPFTIDPNLSGEQIGVSVAENFTGQPTVSTSGHGGSLSSGSAGPPSGGSGLSVSGITGTTSAGASASVTLTASQQFTATTSSAPDSLTFSSGSVAIHDVTRMGQPGPGGMGAIIVSAIISNSHGTIQTLEVPAVPFSGVGGTTLTFNSRTMNGALSGLSGTYTLTLSYELTFTPRDNTAYVSVDPPTLTFDFSSSPLFAPAPVPPTLVLGAIGIVCLGGSHWVGRRRHARPLAI